MKKYLRASIALYLALVTIGFALLVYRPNYAADLHFIGRKNAVNYQASRGKVLQIQDETIPAGSVIFLGDSLIERMPVEQLGTNVYNFGISGDRISDLAERMVNYQSLKAARLIVLEIGTNDDLDFREGDLSELVAKLPPGVPLLWYALPPDDEKVVKGIDIDKINDKSAELCGKNGNCQFVNLTDRYADSAGNLKYHRGDGIHLSAPAYRIWLSDLQTRV